MLLDQIPSKLQFWSYQAKTICRSFKYLYTLPPEAIESFLNSYIIYDHDWVDEEKMIQEWGPNYSQEVGKKLVDYYSVLNHLCALGQVEKMYIPPAIDLSKSIIANQMLFEERMAQDLKIGPNERVLDVGCGRGRVACHMASYTGANVVGVNIDDNQLESARKFALGKGFGDQCQFSRWDLNELPFPFPDNSFDAIYEIQVVFSLSKDREKLFKELHRVLKKGGRFGSLEWVLLDKYDPQNEHHVHLMKQIKPLIGAIGNPTIPEIVNELQSAGFSVVVNENASINGLQSPLIENADKYFTRIGRLIERLVRWKVLPAHMSTLFERLSRGGEAFIEADKMGLVTTSHYMVAEKQ